MKIFWAFHDVQRIRATAQVRMLMDEGSSSGERDLVDVIKSCIRRSWNPEVGKLVGSGTKAEGFRYELTLADKGLRVTARARVVDKYHRFYAEVAAYDRSSGEWKTLYRASGDDAHRVYDSLMHSMRTRESASCVAGIGRVIQSVGLAV